jgi:hypothetical protein
LRFYKGVGVRDLKFEESESEILCSDFTALLPILGTATHFNYKFINQNLFEHTVLTEGG